MAATEQRRIVRPTLSVIAGVVAVIMLVLSLVTAWAGSTLLNSDRFATSVGVALEEPEVTRALSEAVADRVIEAADLDGFVSGALPEQLALLTPVIEGGARYLVTNVTDEILQTAPVQAGLVELVRTAHGAALEVLEGDGLVPGLSVDDEEVAFNLLPLVGVALERVQSRGLLQSVRLPDLAFDGDPTQQIQSLERSLGRTLPPDFGQLVVYRGEVVAEASEVVKTARRALALAKRLAVVIYLITAVLFGVSLVLARRRPRAAVMLALGVAAAVLIARAVTARLLSELPSLVKNPGGAIVLARSSEQLAADLVYSFAIAAVVALVVALATILFSSRRSRDAALTRYRSLTAIAAFAAAVLLVLLLGVGLLTVVLAIGFAVVGLVLLATDRTPLAT